MARTCNLAVLLYKNNMTAEKLSKVTGISIERINRLMKEPEDPKDWEATTIASALGVGAKTIWPDIEFTTKES